MVRIENTIGLVFHGAMSDTAKVLMGNLDAFTAFARLRLGDPELARDAVQESLAKALRAEQLPPDEEAARWFYRILRRTIIDLYRRRDAHDRMMNAYAENLEAATGVEETKALCRCIDALVPELPGQYATLIRRIDLGGETIASMAEERGVTANALAVQLHRARRRLRELLEATCQVCATHGCLDCHCGESPG